MTGGGLGALRFLGLVAEGPQHRPQPRPQPRPSTRRGARPGERPHPHPHQRRRGRAPTAAAGTRRGATLSRPAPADRRQRPPAGPRSTPRRTPPRPGQVLARLLVVLGLAERPVRLTGHPRLRQRAMEAIEQRRRRERVITGSLGLVLLLVLMSWAVLRSPLLAVESVAVVGVAPDQAEEVRAVAGVRPGRNVLDVDLDDARADVAALPWVAQATVRRRLPSTVEIRVSARRPVLAGTHDGRAYLVDAEGVVIDVSERPPAELPTMPLDVAPSVGQELPAGPIADVAAVAAQVPPGLGGWITGYRAAEGGQVEMLMRVPTASGPVDLVAHLGRPVDVEVKARTIASLIAEALDQGLRPHAVDVRIPDRPVVLA